MAIYVRAYCSVIMKTFISFAAIMAAPIFAQLSCICMNTGCCLLVRTTCTYMLIVLLVFICMLSDVMMFMMSLHSSESHHRQRVHTIKIISIMLRTTASQYLRSAEAKLIKEKGCVAAIPLAANRLPHFYESLPHVWMKGS